MAEKIGTLIIWAEVELVHLTDRTNFGLCLFIPNKNEWEDSEFEKKILRRLSSW